MDWMLLRGAAHKLKYLLFGPAGTNAFADRLAIYRQRAVLGTPKPLASSLTHVITAVNCSHIRTTTGDPVWQIMQPTVNFKAVAGSKSMPHSKTKFRKKGWPSNFPAGGGASALPYVLLGRVCCRPARARGWRERENEGASDGLRDSIH